MSRSYANPINGISFFTSASMAGFTIDFKFVRNLVESDPVIFLINFAIIVECRIARVRKFTNSAGLNFSVSP